MVASGRADIDCANTTATLSRMQDVDFSSLIFLETGGLLVKRWRARQAIRRPRRALDRRHQRHDDGNAPRRAAQAAPHQREGDAGQGRQRGARAARERARSTRSRATRSSSSASPCRRRIRKRWRSSARTCRSSRSRLPSPRGDSAFRLEVNRALTQVYVGGELESIFLAWLGPIGRPSGMLAAMYLLNAIPQ